jgi:hypothetical protein
MEMAARVGDKSLERIEGTPAVEAVEGAPLTGVEFFGIGDEGLLLQFGGSRLEIMPGTHVDASRGGAAVSALELRAALSRAAGLRVSRVRVDRGRRLTLEFAGGLVLAVSLHPQDRPGLESAAYYDEAWRYEAY